MASTNSSWTPCSLQLRLAFRTGNFEHLGFAPTKKKRYRKGELRALSVAKNGEPRHDWDSMKPSGDFGGWLDSEDSEHSVEPVSENWLKGTLIAGATGIILVVGLTHACLSPSKRYVFGSKQEAAPLAVKQEVSFVSDEEFTSDKVSADGNGANVTKLHSERLEHFMGFPETKKAPEGSATTNVSSVEVQQSYGQQVNDRLEHNRSRSFIETPNGIPAPLAALQVNPGKLLRPTVVDPVQAQAFAALQGLKVIESDAQPGELCTRREFARWLVCASNTLSRNSTSKVYPAMYIENVTELAFDDITPEDPDFPFIQGLAEAGLISSKLSLPSLPSDDHQEQFLFFPECALSRQDLVSWKMALEKRRLPETDIKMLYEISGFMDIERISPEAWPSLMADLSTGEQGIIALAFGCTRLFQPSKPVTKAQVAVALSTGEASDIVSEELTRIEAENMAENAVFVHDALVTQVENEINASFEKELIIEREKVDAIEKMAEQTKLEIEKLRVQREEKVLALEKERLAIESELKILSRLRTDLGEQFQSLMSNKAELLCNKERISKLGKQAEEENREIARLQHELEDERKALSIARAWAEDEANRAREQAKALEEARGRWERHGIKIVVESSLTEERTDTDTWLNAGKKFSVEGTIDRAENLINQLKVFSKNFRENSRMVIEGIIQKILCLVSALKNLAPEIGNKSEELGFEPKSTAEELKNRMSSAAVELKKRMSSTAEELKTGISSKAEELKDATGLKAKKTVEAMKKGMARGNGVKDGVNRVGNEWRDRVGRFAEKFRTS